MSAARKIGGGRCGNAVLDALPADERAAVLARAQRVALAYGDPLCDAAQPIRAVYFPTGGLVALLAPIAGRPALAVGLIGREGLVGAMFARGDDAGGLGAVVQGEGSAWRVAADDFAPLLARRPRMHRALEQALHDALAQVAGTAACQASHDIAARLAGWLSLAAARDPGAALRFTHQQLADLLGVQRSAVTLAAGALKRRRLIRYVRGTITVLAPAALADAGCACLARAPPAPPRTSPRRARPA